MHYLIGAIGSVVANGSRPVVKLGQRDRVGFHPSMQIRDVASLLLVLLCNTGTSAPVFPRATTCKTPPDPHFVLKGTSGRQSPSPLEAAVVGDLPNVHFCYFGIWQVVLCFEVAGECSVQGRLFFFFYINFCHQWSIPDAVILFIFGGGTPACTRSSHVCFLITCDATPFSFASFPLFTTCTDGPEVTAPVSLREVAWVPTLRQQSGVLLII